jgi:leucyl/phenylalanyl-tRNA---protein transferase
VTLDTAFREVMRHCALPRRGNPAGGTWITPEMIEAYAVLHDRGLAHSAESWRMGKLVGGLYGVALGNAFFGESMFSNETDASKVAFVHLVRQLERWGYAFIDCQISSEHLFSLGAEEIRRHDFMARLERALEQPERTGRWRFEADLTV